MSSLSLPDLRHRFWGEPADELALLASWVEQGKSADRLIFETELDNAVLESTVNLGAPTLADVGLQVTFTLDEDGPVRFKFQGAAILTVAGRLDLFLTNLSDVVIDKGEYKNTLPTANGTFRVPWEIRSDFLAGEHTVKLRAATGTGGGNWLIFGTATQECRLTVLRVDE